MGKPYSVDLRKRVVAAVEGGMSRNQAAKRFGVAISTAIGWMQRVEQTGSVAPGQMGGHKPKAISGEYATWLSQRIRAGDFTLRGLVAELGGRGLKVDYRSVWEFVLYRGRRYLSGSTERRAGAMQFGRTRARAMPNPHHGLRRRTLKRDEFSLNRFGIPKSLGF